MASLMHSGHSYQSAATTASEKYYLDERQVERFYGEYKGPIQEFLQWQQELNRQLRTLPPAEAKKLIAKVFGHEAGNFIIAKLFGHGEK